jgi:type I restriction enzyme M protein
MEGALRTAMPPEVLFIERCVQSIKPGTGKLGISGARRHPRKSGLRIRPLLDSRHCQVLASVDLPVETFLPRTGTQTSVLILRRKAEQEKLAQSLSTN